MHLPLPSKDGELHTLLIAFHDAESINLLSYEEAMIAEDFTPNIIPTVDIKDLCQVTGSVKGCMYKLHEFAHKWSSLLEEKRSGKSH